MSTVCSKLPYYISTSEFFYSIQEELIHVERCICNTRQRYEEENGDPDDVNDLEEGADDELPDGRPLVGLHQQRPHAQQGHKHLNKHDIVERL